MWVVHKCDEGTKLECLQNNLTVTAQWTKLPSDPPSSSSSSSSTSSSSSEIDTKYIKVVIGTKDITREEAEDIIRRHTDEGFTIERFEKDENTGETTIIIRFKDTETANNFANSFKKIKVSSLMLVTSNFSTKQFLCVKNRRCCLNLEKKRVVKKKVNWK